MREIRYPLIGAMITGFFGGLMVGVWVWALDAGDPLKAGGLAGAVFTFLAWLIFRARVEHVENSLRGYVEQAPAPPPQVEAARAETIRVELRADEGRSMDFINLPATRLQVTQLARGLMAGAPFTVASWTGSRRPFSRAEFEALRAELIKRGLAQWRNERSPAQGAELTAKGRAVMRYLAQTPPPPG